MTTSVSTRTSSLSQIYANQILDMVLENVTELYVVLEGHGEEVTGSDIFCSDYSGNHTKLKKILLNGNNICMVSSSYSFTFRFLTLLVNTRW